MSRVPVASRLTCDMDIVAPLLCPSRLLAEIALAWNSPFLQTAVQISPSKDLRLRAASQKPVHAGGGLSVSFQMPQALDRELGAASPRLRDDNSLQTPFIFARHSALCWAWRSNLFCYRQSIKSAEATKAP